MTLNATDVNYCNKYSESLGCAHYGEAMGIWKDRIQHNLNRLMAKHKVTQAQLARLLDISPSNVSRWMSGKASPDLSQLEKMHTLLGWSPDELTAPFANEPASSPRRTKLDEIAAFETFGESMNYDVKVIKRPGKTKRKTLKN
jgi:transcriptional regulator with XRE-family HTH domain